MPDRDLESKIRPVVIVSRIIVLALAAGVLGFAGVATMMRLDDPQQPQAPPPQGQAQAAQQPEGGPVEILTMMAILAAPIAMVFSRVVPAIMVAGSRKQIANGTYGLSKQAPAGGQAMAGLGDAAPYAALYQVKTIVGAALLEGAAFFAVVAFMLERSWIALAMAAALAAMILTLYPSVPRVAEWIRRQQRLVEDEQRASR
jgi:hypothetical protein